MRWKWKALIRLSKSENELVEEVGKNVVAAAPPGPTVKGKRGGFETGGSWPLCPVCVGQ